jgi:zinc/manganese transport system substrate-binding protein
MEAFLKDLIANAGNPNLKVVDSSQGVATITTESLEGEVHTHGSEDEHDHGEFNPHIWLDPKRAIRQVENIRDGLIAADPEGKAVYTANAAAFIEKLKALDAEITASLQPYQGKTFIAYHDFAPYFAQSYRLKGEFLVDLPEENPSPADVKRVIDTARASNLKTLLTEPEVGQAAFSGIAADLKVQVSTFDPLESGDMAAQDPEYYLKVMRQNLQNLKTAFGQGTTQTRLPWVPPSALIGRMAW